MYKIEKDKDNKYKIINSKSKRTIKTFTNYDEALIYLNLKNGKKIKGFLKKFIKNKKALTIAGTIITIFAIVLSLIIFVMPKNKGITGVYEGDLFKPDYSNLQKVYPKNIHKEGEKIGPLYVNFLELGNKYVGDSTYIIAGDNDILIDAGSRANSATAIKKQIDDINKKLNRRFDNKLEYVIVTHMHQDHIAGFVGESSKDNGIFDVYQIDNIIEPKYTSSTSELYKNYREKVDSLKSKKTNVLTSDMFFEKNGGVMNIQKVQKII